MGVLTYCSMSEAMNHMGASYPVQFRGSIDILNVLARHFVSHINYNTKAAEAPAHQSGDLGFLEEVRNSLAGAHTLGYGVKKGRKVLAVFALVARKRAQIAVYPISAITR